MRDVLTATSSDEAKTIIAAGGLDAAILDLHLGDEWSYDVANLLKKSGVPFVFSSGTVEVADGFHDVPLVMKPFSADQLVAALLQVTADRDSVAAQ